MCNYRLAFTLCFGFGHTNNHVIEFCQEILKEAIFRYGKPDIFNIDHGSEFSLSEFMKILIDTEIKISMIDKGRALDNIFVERLWPSVKYEYIYLSKPDTGKELYSALEYYFRTYNSEILHQSLDSSARISNRTVM